jgi:Mor family transcriptional regulator
MPISEKLRLKWEKKLKASGFVDIENADGSLKAEVDPRTIAYALKDGRAEYYSGAAVFLTRFKFASALEKSIWHQHCEGISFRTIAASYDLTFYKVRTIINKLQKLAGLKK